MGSKQDVLDFLVTQEQLGVTLVGAAIQNAPGTPSEGFLPVLKNVVTTEYHHVEALKKAGGEPLTTSYWFPDAAFGDGGIGLFETIELVETIEISLYLIGVSAFAREGDDFGARLCAEAMGTEAVHRALVRFAQGELGNKEIGAPNDEDSRTSTGPPSPRSASRSRSSASVTGPRARSPASSTSTPATRSQAASARRSTTPTRPDNRAVARRASAAPAALTGVHGHSRRNPHRDDVAVWAMSGG